MPNAYENFNTAMLSIADNDESYSAFNDVTSIGGTGVLSPYSSAGSQGNMSNLSPMSISMSPQHMTDYITLPNATAGEPFISILIQPMKKFRFRYKSEMIGTHGTIIGTSGENLQKKQGPTVQLHNFSENAVIRCSLVTTDPDCRIPHAHKLVRRENILDRDDPYDIEVSSQNDFKASFTGMGIIHTARKHIKEELVRKMCAKLLEERKLENRNATISFRDEVQIKSDADRYQRVINLNSVALCFQAFMINEDIMIPITAPVYSNSINNLKSALTGDLKICRIDKFTSSCEGDEEVFIFVEKVGKKNIKIKFFELDDNDQEIWVDYGRFSELDVHHQYAIVFRTPPYKDLDIKKTKEVYIQLERPSDFNCSEPIRFKYKPSDHSIMGRKRTRVSHSNSTELTQMAFHNNQVFSNIHISSNDSTEISKEIKKMLEDGRCSSKEFQDFVEQLDLESYTSLLINSENDQLTFDGPSIKKEDDKSFAENIVMDALKSIREEPNRTKQRDIIRSLLKDKTTYGDSPLHSALRYGQKDIVKYILMLISSLPDHDKLVNIQNSSGKTSLHYAVTQNQPKVTEALLLLDADPNLADYRGQMPLHSAVKCQEAGESVDVLLREKRTNFEARTDLGQTPLQLAAEAGSHHAVKSLIRAGANANSTDTTYGRTALHIAVEGGHRNIVEILLKESNIDVNTRNFSGNTALHSAAIISGAKACDIYSLLRKYNADPYIQNNIGEPSNDEMHEVVSADEESDLEDKNIGLSSIETSNKFDLSFNQNNILEEISLIKKEEDIDDVEKIWLDMEQEKQLAMILDNTKGWEKLINYFDFKYLLKTFQRSSSSPALLLLNYIAIQSNISLTELQNVLQYIDEEEAATYMQQVLSNT